MSSVWTIDFWHITLRLFLAVILGGLIGLERELHNHSAGFRTHTLVCIGSALIMLLSVHGFSDFVNELNVRVDPSRLAAQVISGIGFLGAGTIIRNGTSISGLTTAASLWVTAGIGLAVGAGFYKGALVGAFFVLICLFLLNKAEQWFGMKQSKTIKLILDAGDGQTGKAVSDMESTGIRVRKVRIAEEEVDGEKCKVVICWISEIDDTMLEHYFRYMQQVGSVRKIESNINGKKVSLITSKLGLGG
ncbi:MgtC/SapB family protein [Paenibacillus thalictri]|uniref:MgtC/SapB family protein n=1 Tax=Paenibacillus thalictri TaxID=2527873 RepID=A0A4Q9DZL1_9BACL|nr:MgtC/SapB family protein [Paenibacillus thalictri]TBL81876.1 MgtC/SapB family protein [Paenibacillus thalictri]